MSICCLEMEGAPKGNRKQNKIEMNMVGVFIDCDPNFGSGGFWSFLRVEFLPSIITSVRVLVVHKGRSNCVYGDNS